MEFSYMQEFSHYPTNQAPPRLTHFIRHGCCRAMLVIAALLFTLVSAVAKEPPPPEWLNSAVIYCIYPQIFSDRGFQGVTAQLDRLHRLGVNVLWLMPITPVGQPTRNHPAFGSPYAVQDYYAVNPEYGSEADLKELIRTAHGLGMKVLLDEVLNHTSWDNLLTVQHPEFYRHSDNNPHDPGSEQVAFTFNDVVQLDYRFPHNGLWTYMDEMLKYWITTYDVDGFRFDTANNPPGMERMINQDFWLHLRTVLKAAKPDVLLLGEEEDTSLALAPFELDYGWNLQSAVQQAANGTRKASDLQGVWKKQTSGWPAGMMHLSLTQNWDLDADLKLYGGALNAMDAATFNFTLNGVPLLFNGEEVGNDQSGNNTHKPIHWDAPQASAFTRFYTDLLALRNANPALQQGTMSWEVNSEPAQVVSYLRSSGPSEFLIEINFSSKVALGTVTVPAGNLWTDVSPSGSPGGRSHVLPGALELQPHDFAVFERSTIGTASGIRQPQTTKPAPAVNSGPR
jgi:glycosidase